MFKNSWVEVKEGSLFCRINGKRRRYLFYMGGLALSLTTLRNPKPDASTDCLHQQGCGRSTGEIESRSINLSRDAEDLEELRQSFGFPKIDSCTLLWWIDWTHLWGKVF